MSVSLQRTCYLTWRFFHCQLNLSYILQASTTSAYKEDSRVACLADSAVRFVARRRLMTCRSLGSAVKHEVTRWFHSHCAHNQTTVYAIRRIMASFPAQQPAQRRQSPTANTSSSSTSSQPRSSHVSPVRSRSEDSQTIFVHNPDKHEEEQEQVFSQDQRREVKGDSQIGQNVPPLNIDDDPSIKKCWICFSDSTEDTPETSPWRDPCPCALQAHEECLLDWIADMEAPKSSRNRSGVSAPKIECPQCKAEIQLARPRDYVVDAVNTLDRLAVKMVTPGALLTLGGMVYSSSLAWGIHSIYAIFGAEDGFRILRPWIENAARAPVEVYVGSPSDASRALFNVVIDHLVHWRLYVGLPLISPILILSRTSLADNILPVVPIVFFASQAHSPSDALDFSQWPPSASFAFAVLPYVRSLYNFYYDKVWAEKSNRWLREIQPRAGADQNADVGGGAAPADAGQAGAAVADDENIFEVRIDGGIWEDWNEEDELEQQALNNARFPPPEAEMIEEDPAAPAPVVQDNRPQPGGGANALPDAAQQAAEQPAAARPARANNPAAAGGAAGERRLSFSPTAIAETVIGALLFPTIAGVTGEALRLVLPTSWTTTPVPSGRFGYRLLQRGFLQQKWARSIIGGCLFVVCKDALMLYVRWKMAQMHRKRTVVDYAGKKKGIGGRDGLAAS